LIFIDFNSNKKIYKLLVIFSWIKFLFLSNCLFLLNQQKLILALVFLHSWCIWYWDVPEIPFIFIIVTSVEMNIFQLIFFFQSTENWLRNQWCTFGLRQKTNLTTSILTYKQPLLLLAEGTINAMLQTLWSVFNWSVCKILSSNWPIKCFKAFVAIFWLQPESADFASARE